MPLRTGETFAIAVASSLIVHGGVALAFELADLAGKLKRQSNTMSVEFDIEKELPPPPVIEEPEPLPPPPVEPEAPKVVDKKIKESPKVSQVDEPEPPAPIEPPTEAPAPGEPAPDNEAPAPEFVYTMPATGTQGTMAVRAGSGPTGKARGVKGGTGTGDGGGGAPQDSTGIGPRVVSVAAVKKMPSPIGDDYDYNNDVYKSDDAAYIAGIEGDVIVKLLVDEKGQVAEAKVVKGLGYGLDEKALSFARKRLKFEPAIDTDGKAVAVRITWTFHFTLPKN